MVAVPADAAADVQEQAGNVFEDGGDLVGEVFRGMEVAGVEAIELLPGDGVAEVELVRADDVALAADAEELALDGVEMVRGVEGFGEDGVERGFEITAAPGGLATAFRADFGNGPLVVGICAEYDALPDIGHACGHNIIAASAVGTALALAEVADELGLTVALIGTPAEEVGGGKALLLKAGTFDDVAATVMLHPGPMDIAAARSLYLPVLASDIDPTAVAVARDNARLNRVAPLFRAFAANGVDAGWIRQRRYDLIFANILEAPLRRMSAPMAGLLAPGGRLILSGLLPAHAAGVIAAYRRQGLRLQFRLMLDGWVTLVMTPISPLPSR